MEDRKELSEILLGNKKTTTDGKKSVFVVIAALVIFGIAAFAVWKFLSGKQERLAIQSPTEVIDPGAMKPLDLNGGEFGNDLSGFDTFGSNEPSPFDMNNFGNTAPAQDKNSDIDNVIRNITQTPPNQPPRVVQPTPQPQTLQPQAQQSQQRVVPAQAPTSAPRQATSQPSSITSNASKNGSAPTRGFYWQLGSFANQPAPEFLSLVKKYSYRIQRAQKDQVTISRYLLGPYNSRDEAPAREEVARIFKENPVPVEIP